MVPPCPTSMISRALTPGAVLSRRKSTVAADWHGNLHILWMDEWSVNVGWNWLTLLGLLCFRSISWSLLNLQLDQSTKTATSSAANCANHPTSTAISHSHCSVTIVTLSAGAADLIRDTSSAHATAADGLRGEALGQQHRLLGWQEEASDGLVRMKRDGQHLLIFDLGWVAKKLRAHSILTHNQPSARPKMKKN